MCQSNGRCGVHHWKLRTKTSLLQKEVGEEVAVCQHKNSDPDNVYSFAVKIDVTKTVQIKCNNYLFSFQLHFIINFVLTEPKLPSEISACSISLFMNVIMAKTGSTAKYIRQMKYFQQSAKISSR